MPDEVYVFPMSFAQRRLWLLHRLEQETPMYNIISAVRLAGRLNLPALEKSIEEIVQRHEILRTTFGIQNGEAVQIIHPNGSACLRTVDRRELPPSEREAETRRWIDRGSEHLFDLAAQPLIQVVLLSVADDEHILVSTMHHIVSDGWSTGVFVRELITLYTAFAEGRASPLDELPVQYADFTAWQREWLSGSVLENLLGYWQQRLSGAAPLLDLPADRPRPAVQSYRGSTAYFDIPADVTGQLKSLSVHAGASLFMTTLAAFVAFLYRYSGQHDISIGTPIANRNQRELEPLIGFFVNTLVLRHRMDDKGTFRQLIEQTRRTSLDAFAHQDLPFERLVEALQPNRGLSASPLFQVMFVLQNMPAVHLDLPGLRVTPLPVERRTALFDLTLAMQETDGELTAAFEYNTDLFQRSTAERMITHFQTMLRAFAFDPDTRLADAPLLSEVEMRQVLENGNETANPACRSDHCIHKLIELQVERTPAAVAVVCGNRRLTYHELNVCANQVAHCLRSLGVTPAALVGISVERSIEMVVGLLAILKAGGAYVPLDPAYPRNRLTYMLEDSGAKALITQERLLEKLFGRPASLPAQNDRQVVEVSNLVAVRLGNRPPASTTAGPDARANGPSWDVNPVSGVAPIDLMYVIYTSGSTGTPKGTGVYHHSFVNLVNWFVQRFGLTAADSPLLVSSLSFDLTQKNIFAPLILGGTLNLFPSEPYDPTEIAEYVASSRATWINCTPSAAYPLVEANSRRLLAKLSSLRYLFLGGEPISLPRIWNWLSLPECRAKVVNTYGPTECTDICAAFVVEAPEQYLERVIPIGKAIFNTALYVLDQHRNPVPVGVRGELHIGGVGVGAGYIHDVALTAEKFVPNPFSEEPGVRLYNTGDLVCYLSDGNIEFLGRKDNEIKVRGFRINLQEIEACLTEHPAVRESVAVIREDTPGRSAIVAYVVTDEPPGIAKADAVVLREHLKAELPDYMIPSAFVFLDQFPLTPSGKVDRCALLAHSVIDSSSEFTAPRTSTETSLAAIWAEVLPLERIGINDNFFEVGGHSLLATQVIARIGEVHQVELPLRVIFERPTIAELGVFVAEQELSHTDDRMLESMLAEVEDLSD